MIRESAFTEPKKRPKPSEALALHREVIKRVVAEHRASNPRVFGSVLHGEDTEDSDLDILVDPTSHTTLMDIAAIQVVLHELLGISVDVLTPMSLPDTFRAQVILEAIPV